MERIHLAGVPQRSLVELLHAVDIEMIERFRLPMIESAPDGGFVKWSDYATLDAALTECIKDRDDAYARVDAMAARCKELEKDAELGRIAIRYVDRSGDYCEQDPAERICDEFANAMGEAVMRLHPFPGERLVNQQPDADESAHNAKV